jgi:hypothetical protein
MKLQMYAIGHYSMQAHVTLIAMAATRTFLKSEDEIGRVCSRNGAEEERIQGLVG